MKKSCLPDFSFEERLWRKNYLVLGVDEVGRGALAGPVVAAAVSFWPNQHCLINLTINDSKRLSPQKREELSCQIKKVCFSWGVGVVSNRLIDKKGIVWATKKAMKKAIKKIRLSRSRILVDGFGIKKGDQKSISIAAASIIAKVYRDRLMVNLSLRFPFYGWEKNKGYGTKFHREAIARYGLSSFHRNSFIK